MGTWIKTPGNKLYNILSIVIQGSNLICKTPTNHEIAIEYPSIEYASCMLDLIQRKIQNNEGMIDLTTLKL